MLRRIRGVVVLSIFWALAWLPCGLLMGALMGGLRDGWLARDLGVWTLIGAGSGAVFAILIGFLERRRGVDELSAARLVVWGAIAGVGVPLLVSAIMFALIPGLSLSSKAPGGFAFMALVGALSAWATLALARRGRTAGVGDAPRA